MPLYRGGSARVSVKTRKINWRSRTVAPSLTPGARINSPSAGAFILQRAMSRSRCLVFIVSRSQVAFLASSSARDFSTSLAQFLDRLVQRVFFQNGSLVHRLLKSEESLPKRKIFGGQLPFRDVPLGMHPTRPFDTVNGAGEIRGSQFQLAERLSAYRS